MAGPSFDGPSSNSPGGVYWLGADGNYYAKAGGITGVVKVGKSLNNPLTGTSNVTGLTQIADPNAPAAAAPTSSSGAPLNTAAVSNTQIALDQLPALLANALSSEDTSFNNTNAGYDATEKQQQGQYDDSTTTNQQNYDSNFMDSIRAGIKGLASLTGLLRGTGAAGGTAEDQVHDIVGSTTANDIRTGADTQKANQATLDSTLSQVLTDLKGKRQAAIDTHANNTAALQRDNATQMQDLFSKMAGYYGDAGDTADANSFMSKAGALTPTIAQNTKTQTSAYDTTPVAVQAPQLTAFSAPSQPNVVAAPSDGQVGSGIFSIGAKRKDNSTPVLAAAGA